MAVQKSTKVLRAMALTDIFPIMGTARQGAFPGREDHFDTKAQDKLEAV